MADDVELRVTAKDDASKTLDKIQDKGQQIDGMSAEISVDATDNASDVIDEDKSKLEALDGETATVETEADDGATETLDAVEGEVQALDGETATVDAEADDNATEVLGEIRSTAEDLDGFTPEITPEVDDSAVEDLGAIQDAAEELDGLSPEITPQVDSSGIDAMGEAASTATGHTDALTTSAGFLVGKLGGSAGGVLGTAAPAAAGVLALGAAAFAATEKFGALALEAQNFATAAGTSTEEASRWIEVAGDLGVNADSVESSIGRMNKNLGSGKISMSEFGLETGTTSDNFVNLLRYVGSIPDAAKQAAVGGEIFGKGWQSLAPLIVNVEDLNDRLGDVAKQKVMTPEQIRKAEELRDAMDNLKDSVEEAALSLGQDLVPALKEAAEGAVSLLKGQGLLNNQVKESPGFWDNLKSSLGIFTGGTEMARQAQEKQTEATKKQTDAIAGQTDKNAAAGVAAALHAGDQRILQAAMDETTKSVEEATKAQEDHAKAAQDSADALTAEATAQNTLVESMRTAADSQYAANKAQRDYADAAAELPDKLDKIAKSGKDAETIQRETAQAYDDTAHAAVSAADAQVRLATDTDAAAGKTTTATQKLDTWNSKMLASASTAEAGGPLQTAILGYIATTNQIPAEKVTEIQAAIARGDLAEAQRLLDEASKARTASILADADTAAAKAELDRLAEDRTARIKVITDFIAGRPLELPPGAQVAMAGTPYSKEGVYDVGEAGRERVWLPRGSRVDTAGRTMMADLRSGQVINNTYNINVTVPVGQPTAEVGRYVTDAIDAFERRSGRRRRSVA